MEQTEREENTTQDGSMELARKLEQTCFPKKKKKKEKEQKI